MRVTDDTRFPHPVLSPDSDDFPGSSFAVGFSCEENPVEGKVIVHHEIELHDPEIGRMVSHGIASVGAFVRCRDTYFSSLQLLGSPTGQTAFPDGKLLNRVTLRPLIWVNQDLTDWAPKGVAPEFSGAVSLSRGSIIGLGHESVMSVGQAKLAPLESIFTLKKAPELPPKEIRVDLGGDKIIILAGEDAFEVVSGLRLKQLTRPAAFSAVYLPVVMEVLEELRSNSEAYEGRRWLTPFEARCDQLGIILEDPDTLQDAQRLLDYPISKLRPLAEIE